MVVVNHLEPDHSGSLKLLREVFPDIEIVGTQKTVEFLGHLYGMTDGLRAVGDGEELALGRHKLKFFLTPMVHWPETMMTLELGERILFSGDAFGGFGTLDGGIFDDQVDIDYFDDEILRYFSNIVGKYCAPVQKALAKLGGVDVETIAPTHGPVWRQDPQRIIATYDRWSRQEAEPGVVIAYASMYGNSRLMMEAVARGLNQGRCCRVRVHDLSRSHVSYAIRDAWRYQGLVLGGPTYNAELFPPIDYFIRLLEELRLHKRTVGIFGTYGWSGGGVKALRAFAEKAKFDLLEPVVEARFSATGEDIENCRLLGRRMAESVSV
jgi:flavorubredoxin